MAEKENLLVNLNDITEKEASWLVPQRMPKGQIIILAGDGGSGKTNAWCALAAAISSGKQVFFDETPKEFFQAEPQRVLFFSSEDSLEYTLKARLRKAGANFNNIFSVDLKNERFSEIKFNSELLKSLIEDVKPTLVVFDPLQAFVPVDMQMGQRNAMRACLKANAVLDEVAKTASEVIDKFTGELTGKENGGTGRDGTSMKIRVHAEGTFLNRYEQQYEKETVEDVRISRISKQGFAEMEANKQKKADQEPVELVNADGVHVTAQSNGTNSAAAYFAKNYSNCMNQKTTEPED